MSDRSFNPWKSNFLPLYDIKKTYLENAENGPNFIERIPYRRIPDPKNWVDFLGHKVISPLGVSAGPLLNSKWISLAADLGFDIVCYKTIRSRSSPGHPLPNILFVESKEQYIPEQLPQSVFESKSNPQDLTHLAITNSFGMPSRTREYLQKDIFLSNSLLRPGQIMIVSIVGTQDEENDLIEDFVKTAVLAKESGAKIVEANFSCPNVSTGEGCVYNSPDAVYKISKEIVKALDNIPLIIKMGLFHDPHLMVQALIAAARGGVRGISGINSISAKVLNREEKPALGENRPTSGICGAPIRLAALDFIRQARKIIDREKLDLCLIGGGGITLPEHFSEFFNAGANVAMTATGMMWDPYIALRNRKE